jgi:hypothetical protein
VALAHSGFFVPSFGVCRHLVPDDAALEFEAKLAEFCANKPYRPYPARSIGLTILSKGKFVGAFLRADVQPSAPDMLDLAKNVRDALGDSVKSKPRTLSIAIGSISVFGARNNKLAFTIEGWKGFDKRYASKNENGQQLACHQTVREMNAVVGEIVQYVSGGVDGNGLYSSVSMGGLSRQTPHITFAEKVDRYGKMSAIGNNERADISGRIVDIFPDDREAALQFFDPVVHLSLLPTHGLARFSGKAADYYTNDPTKVELDSGGMYVRRPQFDHFPFGKLLEFGIIRPDMAA